jgi:heme exporter protein B
MQATIDILIKEIRQELRDRRTLSIMFLFAIVVVVTIGFSLKGKTLAPEWGAIIIWLVFLFALLTGVASTFFKEEEARTAMALRLTAEYNAVYWGKTLYNLFISALLGLITIPALVIFAGLHSPDWGLMVMILLPGLLALMSGLNLLAALTAKMSGKSALLTILSFPVVIPVLINGINGTLLVLKGGQLAQVINTLTMFAAYATIMLTVGFFLFEFIWQEESGG